MVIVIIQSFQSLLRDHFWDYVSNFAYWCAPKHVVCVREKSIKQFVSLPFYKGKLVICSRRQENWRWGESFLAAFFPILLLLTSLRLIWRCLFPNLMFTMGPELAKGYKDQNGIWVHTTILISSLEHRTFSLVSYRFKEQAWPVLWGSVRHTWILNRKEEWKLWFIFNKLPWDASSWVRSAWE